MVIVSLSVGAVVPRVTGPMAVEVIVGLTWLTVAVAIERLADVPPLLKTETVKFVGVVIASV
jgi:hypothetical protein